jgi:CDP-glucose 4,6-dehydratase
MIDLKFYKNKIVLITGHTGFKGTWLSKILINLGAKVIGYSLLPPTEPNLFTLSSIEQKMVSIIGDIRDYDKLKSVFDTYNPEIVFHLAAQPIVRYSYRNPKYTYETNVLGTVNILECIRETSSVKSFINVTTDKVYLNNDIPNHPFNEDEPLDGYDPYSNSKSCSELVTHSYQKSFFQNNKCAISTARSGNVIGGGDFAEDRIIPDCVRAIKNNTKLIIRNPFSIRPYQHVLEPLYLYLEIAQKQYKDINFQGYYNIGPDDCDCINTGDLATLFRDLWGGDLEWVNGFDGGPHEASFLKLDNKRVKEIFNWSPKWHILESVKRVVDWTRVYFSDKDLIPNVMDKQISDYFKV